ncbi:HIT family protein [Nonomuraea sp. KM88]|uniref:HIT family protein n=1 Tax=Nonomuraea sp. KM88 TaxID=3457427 RepID=UPI003FCDE558
MTIISECYTCQNEARFPDLPPREMIAADDRWRVAHAFNTALPGWLVLIPRRHIGSIADLTDAEMRDLGSWQVLLSRVLRDVTRCEKTYVMQFAEMEGFSHVHFHIVPRASDLGDDLRGPRVFGLMGGDHPNVLTSDEMDVISTKVSQALSDVRQSHPG